MMFEYEIYLPTQSGKGEEICGAVLKKIRAGIIEEFGGLTDTRIKTNGFWKSGGVTIRDEILIWKVVSDQGEAGDTFLKGVRIELEQLLDQDKILIVKRAVETL